MHLHPTPASGTLALRHARARLRLPLVVLSLSSHLQDRFAFFSFVFDSSTSAHWQGHRELDGVPQPLGAPLLSVRGTLASLAI